MSYGRMQEKQQERKEAVQQLLAQAEAADEEEDRRHGEQRGDELPEELRRRETRLAKIQMAKKSQDLAQLMQGSNLQIDNQTPDSLAGSSQRYLDELSGLKSKLTPHQEIPEGENSGVAREECSTPGHRAIDRFTGVLPETAA